MLWNWAKQITFSLIFMAKFVSAWWGRFELLNWSRHIIKEPYVQQNGIKGGSEIAEKKRLYQKNRMDYGGKLNRKWKITDVNVESIVILYYMITSYPLKKITGITFWAKSLVRHDKFIVISGRKALKKAVQFVHL